MSLGDVNAPVVLAQWTDLRCPYCAAFDRDTLPALIQEYVDTGKVRLEVHDVAFFGEQSEQAAVAARAAGKQGLFLEYTNVIYRAAPESGHADLPREKLVQFASDAGIPEMRQFERDLDDSELLSAVRASQQQARSYGVSSVPFFTAGGHYVAGAQSLETFRALLDEALEQP